MKPGDCNLVADLVKALTNPTRLMILCALKDETELKVSDIIAQTRMRQANVSLQLGVLRSKGILNARREEVNVYYSIADRRVLDALELLLDVAKDRALKPALTASEEPGE